MPYFYKRAAKSAECLMDEPVPLSYYGEPKTGTRIYHPSTIRELINLKAKDYAISLGEDMTERKVMDFINTFSKRVILLFNTERMSEFPDHINQEVDNMTDAELDKALEDTPLTLSQQEELGDIIIPAIEDVVAPQTGTRTGTSRYEKPEPKEPEMMDDLLSGATTGLAETPRGGGSNEPFPSFTSRGERAMMRDITRSRGDY